jgi:hypothetical protein
MRTCSSAVHWSKLTDGTVDAPAITGFTNKQVLLAPQCPDSSNGTPSPTSMEPSHTHSTTRMLLPGSICSAAYAHIAVQHTCSIKPDALMHTTHALALLNYPAAGDVPARGCHTAVCLCS